MQKYNLNQANHRETVPREMKENLRHESTSKPTKSRWFPSSMF